MVESIIGREGDVIKTQSGRQLGASIITHLIYVVCGAENFIESQVIQDALDHITIEYVPSEKLTDVDTTAFEQRLAQNLPSELKVSLRKVKSVKRTESGKIRPIVSLID